MRSGELTITAGDRFDPSCHLTPRDITVDDMQAPSMLRIHLKTSKTDRTKQGVDLYVGRTFNSLCPVTAMLRYLQLRGIDDGPLFFYKDGSPLSRSGLVDKVCQYLHQGGVDPTHNSGHSFRIGAATTAAAKSVSDATIQVLG